MIFAESEELFYVGKSVYVTNRKKEKFRCQFRLFYRYDYWNGSHSLHWDDLEY